MPRSFWLGLLATAFLVWFGPGSKAQVRLNPLCDDDGLLIWGRFSSGAASPATFKSKCDATLPVTGISNATAPDVNQLAAFSAGRGVAFQGNVNWTSGNPLPVTFPAPKVLPLKVWVLYTRSDCDFSCVKTKMAAFLVWANDRLSAERTGIQLAAATGSWISDQTALGTTEPIKSLLDFSESGTDCATVRDSFPAAIKADNTLNLYIIQTERGYSHRGIFCADARDMGFANAFVASRATNSTMLHELSHNLGLSHSDAALNLMRQDIQDGVFYSEGQIFHMNFSRSSALNISVAPRPASEQRECENTRAEEGCPAQETWIWPDP